MRDLVDNVDKVDNVDNVDNVVAVIKAACEKDAAAIGEEKKLAEIDLAKAQPYLDEAERAVQSIKPNDLNELKKLAKPTDINKLIFDCVCILRMQVLAKVEKCSITLGIGKEKKTFDFILASNVGVPPLPSRTR